MARDVQLLEFHAELRGLLVGKHFNHFGRLERLADRALDGQPHAPCSMCVCLCVCVCACVCVCVCVCV